MLIDLVIFLCYMSILFFYSIIVITIALVIQLIFYRVFKINLYKKLLKKMRWYYEKTQELIQEELDLLFECPIIEGKKLNYSKEDEQTVLILLNEINKRLFALTLIDAKNIIK